MKLTASPIPRTKSIILSSCNIVSKIQGPIQRIGKRSLEMKIPYTSTDSSLRNEERIMRISWTVRTL